MPTPPRPLRVFLCHASEDKAAVRNLYRRLRAEGVQPWLDEEDLIPGQDWEFEIRKAVRGADVVLVCLSQRAADKAGFVQKELMFALDAADEQPEGTIFVIPLKLEECSIPSRLGRWHCVNYFERRGHERLLRALRARADALPRVTPPSPAGIRRAPGEEARPGAPATDGVDIGPTREDPPAAPPRTPPDIGLGRARHRGHGNTRANEAAAIAYFALSSLTALALVTHDFNDPAWDRARDKDVHNLPGTVGANVAGFLFHTLGLASALLPLLLAAIAWRRFRTRHIRAPLSRLAGLTLLVCAAAGMLSLVHTEPLADRSFYAGGVVGETISSSLKAVLGAVGAGVLLCASAAAGLLFATNFSFIAALERLSALASENRKE